MVSKNGSGAESGLIQWDLKLKIINKPSEPIALSTRLILAKDFIPMPDGMEIEKCEIQGLSNLVIDVSGKAKTEKRDYTTGSVFAFSLFDEANTVTFTEIDTGKVYMFERPSK